MHARDLVELAAVLAAESSAIVRGDRRPSAHDLEGYWTASKCRLERWTHVLRQFETCLPRATGPQAAALWEQMRPLLEEVLASEVLTRIWTGVSIACDHHHGGRMDIAAVARSVLVSHLEARRRTLQLMLRGRNKGVRHVLVLNRLRRRAERWTDLLLGYIMRQCDVSDVAFDAARCRQFATDIQGQPSSAADRWAWPILLASLRAAFQHALGGRSPNADLNARICNAIVGCVGADLIQADACLRSLWHVRLAALTSETEELIRQLLTPDEPTPGFSYSLPDPPCADTPRR